MPPIPAVRSANGGDDPVDVGLQRLWRQRPGHDGRQRA